VAGEVADKEADRRLSMRSGWRLESIDAIEEVAFSKHLQCVVGKGNVLCGPSAKVQWHPAKGFADGYLVHVSTALEDEDG
jgi:hypothetical protein